MQSTCVSPTVTLSELQLFACQLIGLFDPQACLCKGSLYLSPNELRSYYYRQCLG